MPRRLPRPEDLAARTQPTGPISTPPPLVARNALADPENLRQETQPTEPISTTPPLVPRNALVAPPGPAEMRSGLSPAADAFMEAHPGVPTSVGPMIDAPGWWNRLGDQAQRQADEYATKSAGDIWLELGREAGPIAVATAVPVVGQALGRVAPPVVGRAVGAFAERFPKIAAAVQGAVGGGAAGAVDQALQPAEAASKGNRTAAPGEEVPGGDETVKELQRDLKQKGYYKGPIDGRMEGGTNAAKKDYDAAEATKAQQAIERQKGEAAIAAAAAETARAQAETEKANAERDRIAAEAEAAKRRAAALEVGNKRLNEMDKEKPWWRDNSTLLGYIAGGAIGGLTRVGVVKGSDKYSKYVADKADKLMNGLATDAPLAERVSKTNQFFTRGGSEQPFVRDTSSPRGFKVNDAAKEAGDLYKPNQLAEWSTDLGIPAASALVAAPLTDHIVGERARAELAAADAAARAEPNSEVALRRLQTAKDSDAFANMLYQGERGIAAGYGLTALKARRKPDMPDVHAAERQRIGIDQELKAPPPIPTGPTPAPPPPPRADGKPNLKDGYEYRSDGVVYDKSTGHPVAKKYLPLVLLK
jgi:hypothetical protein